MKTILCLIVCALGHKKIPLLRGIETLVAEGGFEPSTHGLWFHRSNQLSYSAILCQNLCQGYANFRLDSNDSYLLSQQDFTNPNRRQCCNKPVFLISSVASYKSSARDYWSFCENEKDVVNVIAIFGTWCMNSMHTDAYVTFLENDCCLMFMGRRRF